LKSTFPYHNRVKKISIMIGKGGRKKVKQKKYKKSDGVYTKNFCAMLW
jgi:tartrate dehydratase beta subunit/fumarate hydratase class I family protein